METGMTDTRPIVRIQGLRKTYGKNEVVRGLELALETGEIFTLLGPSGCGKTTTLRMLAGLERPDIGTIHIGDDEVAGSRFVPPEERRLGMVFQSYAVWPHMTVLQNVSWPLSLQGESNPDPRAREALGKVHLDGLEERFPHTLSGGQQQRVALARALAGRPRVLLLDEPLSNLDAGLREQMRSEIAAIARAEGLTVLLVTHDQEEALSISDRVGVMHEGVLQQVAAPRTLYDEPANAFVAGFVGVLSTLKAARKSGQVELGGLTLSSEGPDGEVNVGFRPEWASFADDGLACEIVQEAFRGSFSRYELRVGDATVTVDSNVAPTPCLRIDRGWVL